MELTRYLLNQSGVHCVLSVKLSQDELELESFFGKQRMKGGYCENPNVSSFLYGAQSLWVQGSTALKPTRGNTNRGQSSQNQMITVHSTP